MRRRWMAVVLGLAAALVLAGPATTANAYSGGGAAAYADAWAKSRNPSYPAFVGTDCANFVSQALHQGGGYSYVGRDLNRADDHYWWVSWRNGVFSWSNSWAVAHDQYQFLLLDTPGGWVKGDALGNATNYWTPDAVVTGDILYYDWQGDGIYDHEAIQVGWGTDPDSKWNGNYVDAHTNDRYHAFWSLRPYNSQWATTRIRFVHVDAGNL